MIGFEEKGNMMTYTEFIKNHKMHYEICSITLIQSAKDGSLSLVSMLDYYKT